MLSATGAAWRATAFSSSSGSRKAARGPSWRRLEGGLCRLRDRDDGVLPADVADQHDHARAEARHRRLFRGAEHRAHDLGRGRRAGRHGLRPGRRARGRRRVRGQQQGAPPKPQKTGALDDAGQVKRRRDRGARRGGRRAQEQQRRPAWSTSSPPTRTASSSRPKNPLRQAMQEMPDIAALSRNVIWRQTPEGLNIQLVDQDGQPMFQPGTANLVPQARMLLQQVAKIVDRLPNRIAITGHTDASNFEGAGGMTNWELSADAGQCRARRSGREGIESGPDLRGLGQGGHRSAAARRPVCLVEPPGQHPVDARGPARSAGPQSVTKPRNDQWRAARIPRSILRRSSLAVAEPRRDVTEHYLSRLPQFFLTPGGACPYLPGKVERKVFARLIGAHAARLNDALTHSGFRRSQMIAYRPSCDGCKACVSVRVVAREFEPRRTMRRVERHQRRSRAHHRAARGDARAIRAACRNIWRARHAGGGMSDMGLFDYVAMVEETPVAHHARSNIAARSARAAPAGPLIALRADRCARRRAVDGLQLLRSRLRRPQPGHLHDPRSCARGGRARRFRMSISAIGCAARRRWITSRASSRLEALGPAGWRRLAPVD